MLDSELPQKCSRGNGQVRLTWWRPEAANARFRTAPKVLEGQRTHASYMVEAADARFRTAPEVLKGQRTSASHMAKTPLHR
jgi:hypothetical protein